MASNPEGVTKEFLDELLRTYKQYYVVNAIDDPHTRLVASRCLDSKMRQIMNDNWNDNWNDNGEDKIINKFKKRWRREGYNVSTFLQKPDIPPDNNEIEQMNRRFVSIRSDGAGNRTVAGMECNSTLFTVRATCNLNNVSFYDTLCSDSSEYG